MLRPKEASSAPIAGMHVQLTVQYILVFPVNEGLLVSCPLRFRAVRDVRSGTALDLPGSEGLNGSGCQYQEFGKLVGGVKATKVTGFVFAMVVMQSSCGQKLNFDSGF